jgi:hypothetical protein
LLWSLLLQRIECESAMSKLGRLIQRRRQTRYPSPIEPAVYQANSETAFEGRISSEIPTNELLSVGTDSTIRELNEIREDLKQASLERGQTYATKAERAVRMFTSHGAQEKGSPGLTVKSGMRYAEFFGINFEWLMTGSRANHEEIHRTSPNSSIGDEDFDLVLRHFWKHLDAENRRKLIQLAAGLVDDERGEL